jgi:hypothetical protein
MPEITISNAAHTIVRRSVIRDLGVWPNSWSRRVPGTTFWLVKFSLEGLNEIHLWKKPGESYSDTLIKMFTIVDRVRRSDEQSTPQQRSSASFHPQRRSY